MSTELLVNVAPFETRIARIESGLAEEIYLERESDRGLKGNIYKGRVQRILPGIQAAFVNIGTEKSGFLYAGDIAVPESHEMKLAAEEVENSSEEATGHSSIDEEEPQRRMVSPISTLLKEGQEILVQVSKDPIASKGPRLTSLLSLAGRYLVYLPGVDHVGIARRLEDNKERERLLLIGRGIKPENGGLIIRTVAEGHSQKDLKKDLDFLVRLWGDVERRSKHAAPGSMIYTDLNLYLRVMRDYVDDEVEKIHIDSREAYQSMKKFAKNFMPEVSKRLYYYPGERPIFDVYGVEEEI
ncbi:MAG: ribonuclease E/G, partial [Mariprofundaceae bacterium]|nr:ribonuclease E/G [Mariprofundaceae bacterium]